MRFSLIIPTYNATATLLRAVSSVFNQIPSSGLEIILVDDCSTDTTPDLLQALVRDHPELPVIVDRLPRNRGPGAARNRGVALARGEWVVFLDGDDALEGGFFAAVEQHLETQTEPPDLVAFDWRYGADPVGPPRGRRDDLSLLASCDATARIREYLLNRLDNSVIFHLFRREFLVAQKIHFRGGYHEDVDYLFHALLAARQVTVLAAVLYIKWDTPGSIVNTLGTRHIKGYLKALEAIWEMLSIRGQSGKFVSELRIGLMNVVSSRLMRLMNTAIVKEDRPEAILQCLYQDSRHLLAQLPEQSSAPAGFQTKYQILFQTFMAGMAQDTLDSAALLRRLGEEARKTWSCYDLHHSLFLAPNQIRTCCKRFFRDGQMQGDVALFDTAPGDHPDYAQVLAAKQALHREINRDNAEQCRSCPFLAFQEWGPLLSNGVRYLSLEYHSVCNMRCLYCSDTYYGGLAPSYDVAALVKSLEQAGALSHCEYVVWGGGEPTIDAQFEPVLRNLARWAPGVKQRVITNATKFSPPLAELLQEDRAFIVTSVDAGSEPLFRKIRESKQFPQVLKNLGRYAAARSDNVIIKYILMEENSTFGELASFTAQIAEHGLLNCNFQISCDFKRPEVTEEEIVAIAELFALLRQNGAHFVFVDDLVWQRLPTVEEGLVDRLKDHLRQRRLPDFIQTGPLAEGVVVWGTGAQAGLLAEKSHLLRQTPVTAYIDPRPSAQAKPYRSHPVWAPEAIPNNGAPILIAAVQSAPFIYRDCLVRGLGYRVLTGLVL